MGDSSSNGVSVQWIFGFSKDVPGGVQSLTKPGRNALFTISAHSGIIYDYEFRTQTVLQGHCNYITCCAISKDKRWIVTADAGNDSLLVVWDSHSGAPVKTLFNPHHNGVCSVDISDDALFVATLSEPDQDSKQELSVWAWTKEEDTPILSHDVLTEERQHEVRFNSVNQYEICTTGGKNVSFWKWEELKLEGYTGKVSKADFGNYSGRFTSTVFLSDTGSALTATDEGYIIVWGSEFSTVLLDDPSNSGMKIASKVLRLVECSINAMNIINNYFVIAGADGAVRFYDFSLRLEAWFEDFMAGPVTSLSFSAVSCPFPEGVGGEPGTTFWVPDFIVGTSDALVVGVDSSVFDEVSPEDRRGTLLVQGMAETVSDVCCHPRKTLVVLSCYNGTLQVWDYDMKLLMNLREFNSKEPPAMTGLGTKKVKEVPFLRPQCVSFDPFGEILAVGFTTGDMKFLFPDSFEDMTSYFFPDPLLSIKFSPSGEYLAGFDAANHVVLLKKNHENAEEEKDEDDEEVSTVSKDAYIYIGRIISHSSPIIDIEFGVKESGETLISIGEDRHSVEYDLENSSISEGVKVVDPSRVRIELTAQPTAISWHPHIGDDVEDRFIVANDEYKMKQFNVDSKQCRKTTLAPTFGGPPNKIMVRKGEDDKHYFVYCTPERIVGIGSLPLTGCPTQVMGLVAHPGRITASCVSSDGKYLFTAGGSDLTIGMWAINFAALPPPSNGIDSFLGLLDGGRDGELHNDIIDYFYLCQLRTQGEDAMEERAIKGMIHISEISSLMRAVGFYPTEEEVENMCNEIRYQNFITTGEAQDELSLEEVIKLYVNHRPVNPLNSNEIDNAFELIADKLKSSGLEWKDLKNLLMSEGEAIDPDKLQSFLVTLVGSNPEDTIGEDIDSVSFASKVLGFEDLVDQE